ncbi:low molecular weight protein-tyrosine-phosphatase [Acinetobacter tianfuensis]|uniref:protein-tyrosine-phosphatase n=1 Tax=Acinetobacter tianfuensis TaxID=2419603 RepID=A0A3A8EB79_9GAMM|nr:low molecular weight protein-tyrosine-phosphatase [Acinetobacter tianfuensis]RKG31925.1 low molecular weight phosphotyrosine protein phosphatase [Acinetobacter tianfuensis]
MQIQHILVVCVGNICRSPMAEYFLKNALPALNISSAGISGLVGHPADDKAKYAMQQLGISMDNHVARKLNADMIKHADLILVMSQNQQKHLEQTWPFAKGKTFRLGHWQGKNVADPYQKDQNTFDESCALIQQCVTDWKQHL